MNKNNNVFNKKEGEVTVQNHKNRNNNETGNIGEYIDFEEIDPEI